MLLTVVILKQKRGELMSPAKVIRIIGVVLAIAVALIPAIPVHLGALLLAIVGLIIGCYVAADNRKNLFLMVVVLAVVVDPAVGAGALDAIPVIGSYIGNILSSLKALLAAACVTSITMIIKEMLSE